MNILLGITGGIAAYKSAELTRLLVNDGFEVRVVMTKHAQQFIAPLTFQALSGHAVATEIFDAEFERGMDHIELSRWADFILIAPASAHFMARFTHGLADDLLTTICLATEAPIAIAPAMNQKMWLNVATQNNISLLKQRGILIYGPEEGEQACGDVGPGRMLAPESLLRFIKEQCYLPPLVGKKILITAGPTREAIDPIRYFTNRSTGTMGYALAESAMRAGAVVTVVSGPTNLTLPKQIKCIRVNTAMEMQSAVMPLIENSDIFISAAAVSDYRPDTVSAEKIKKTDAPLTIRLVRNVDILAKVAVSKQSIFTVGFAAETDALIQNAKSKLNAKNLDIIIANQVSSTSGFGEGETAVTMLTRRRGNVIKTTLQSKRMIAKLIIQHIAEEYTYFI